MRAVDNVVPVTAAGPADIADVAAIAAAATWDTPVAGWLVPDPQQRPGVLHAWYSVLVEQALRYGRVDLLADRSGAAVWLDRTRPVPAPDRFLRRLTAGCGKHALAVLCHEQLIEQHRPPSAHLQLAVLAAPMRRQAAVLLAHRHQHLDRMRVAAYGIAGSRDEFQLMTAAGYLSGGAFPLPDGGPVMWPLWRPPQPVRAVARRVRAAG